MKAKEYLNQAYRLDMEIGTKMQQIDRLRSLTQRMTTFYSYDRQTQHNRNTSAGEDTIISLMDSEEELNREIDRLVKLKKEIGEMIKRVEDDNCRMILAKRYLCYMSWDEIAEDMHYTMRWVLKLHQRGIDRIESILAENRKRQHASSSQFS